MQRTPLIADLLHRISFIEKAGTGITLMHGEARAQGCPEPKFGETGFFTATFFPNPEVRAQTEAPERGYVTEHVGTKLALSRYQVDILAKYVEDQPFITFLAVTGRSDRTKFRNQVLSPLLTEGLVEMTIPDKPRRRLQKSRLTPAGRAVLNRAQEPKATLEKS